MTRMTTFFQYFFLFNCMSQELTFSSLSLSLTHQVFGDSDPALVAAACVALRTCTTFDDLRKDFAGAFDAAKDAVKVGARSALKV